MKVFRGPLWAALVLAAAGVLRAALPFPQQGSDLQPDPAARFGVLPNGLRFVVDPNHEPRGRASLRLLVLSGSLEENDNQQGLAHFLEHMAFNGSLHYAPGTLVEYFQRLGMSFGGDTNAYTSYDHTAYKIELPNVQPATVAEGLRVFADMAQNLLLRPDMIAKERPIILSEKRDRDSIEYREFVASFAFLLPDSLLPRREPIGLTPVIEQAQRDRFVDLYNTWYRPERMVAIVVGDINPAAVIPQIESAFSGVTDRAPARPNPNLGLATVALGLKAGYHHEAEAPETIVSIDVVAPYRPPIETAAIRLAHLRRDLAVAMLNRRLEILAKREGTPFIRASAAIDESYRFMHDAGINIECTAGQWRAALAAGEQQLRRALQYGFTDSELREATANLRSALDQAAASAATRRSPELADELVDELVDGIVFTNPGQDLALYGPALQQVTAQDCLDAFRLAFGSPGRYVYVTGNAKIEGDANAQIAQAYVAAHSVAVQPPATVQNEQFAYTDFGPPGKVVERRQVDDLGITLVRFANGVRLNLKHTAFEQNQIRIRVRAGGGKLTEPRGEPGLSVFTDITYTAGGLGRHSADDLQRLLAGRTVGVDFQVGNDAFEMGGTTRPQDLPLELQLLTAYLTDPGYRPEAMRVARKNIAEFYNQLAHSVEGPLRTEVPLLLASGDDRFGLPDEQTMLGRTLAQEKAWIGGQLARGPIEIGIDGDVEVDTAIDWVSRTLGALPAREAKPAYTAEREVRAPQRTFSKEYSVPTEIPKAVVAVFWPTADARDVHRTRRLRLLGDILQDRLRVKIREQLGGAYSPEAVSEASDTFTDYGLMIAEIEVAPERAQEIERTVVALAADLQAHGVTADELLRAKQPELTDLRESARTNQYWLGAVVGSCQEFPQRLAWARTRYSDVEAITKPELDALAKDYLGTNQAFQVIVHPSRQ